MRTYNIELTDIAGVGPKTASVIRDRLGEYQSDDENSLIPALHLVIRGKPAYHDLQDKGIGSDTLEHLDAIGRAVKGTGPAYVKAKHLTGEIVADAPYNGSSVRIDEKHDSQPDTPDPETNGHVETHNETDVAGALDTIRGEYGDNYPEWGRFIVDLVRFTNDETGHDIEYNEPDHAFPVVRYQKTSAGNVIGDDAWTDRHIDALVQFAQTI